MVSRSNNNNCLATTSIVTILFPHILTQGRLHCTQHAILRTALQVHTQLVREAASQIGVLNFVAQYQVSAEAGSYAPCHWSAPEILNPQHPP